MTILSGTVDGTSAELSVEANKLISVVTDAPVVIEAKNAETGAFVIISKVSETAVVVPTATTIRVRSKAPANVVIEQ
jgi:hypothetical protein